MKMLLFSAVCLAAFASFVIAQGEETRKNEFTVWGGFSPDSNTFVRAVGRTEDARFGLIAFRYSRRFNNNDKFNLKYYADVIPAAFLSYPDLDTPSMANIVRPTRYAFGASPLGLQVNLRPRKRLQPFAGISGGMLYFNQRIPNFVGTRFNFISDIGAGIEFRLTNKRALTVGYKYAHISNASRGVENPGFDNNLFYVGYTFFSK